MKQVLETKDYKPHIDYKPFIAILYKMKDKALELKVSCNEQNTENAYLKNDVVWSGLCFISSC